MSSELTLTLWTMLLAGLASMSCALVGCYLVLRKLSLLGDAISHAVLPGIVLAYLLFETRTGLPLLFAALLMGILTAFLTSAVARAAKVGEDAGMGIVFTSLFALGVLLLTRNAANVDLDVSCVLMGQLETAVLQTQPFAGIEVPEVGLRLLLVFLGVISLIVLLWKELKIVSFDPALASAIGISTVLIHYGLMAVTAVVTVASFEAVGSILVIAMLIVPATTAHLLTQRLRNMLIVAALLAFLAAILGTLLARWCNASYAGMMAVVAGGQFTLAVLFAPHHGVVQRLYRAFRLRLRIAAEDVLALLYRREEVNSTTPRALTNRVTSRWQRRFILGWLKRGGWITVSANGMLELTDRGRQRAASVVRAHRLWEAYLQQETTLPPDHLHEPAEWMEHFLDEQMQRSLREQTGQPHADPHGRPIPE